MSLFTFHSLTFRNRAISYRDHGGRRSDIDGRTYPKPTRGISWPLFILTVVGLPMFAVYFCRLQLVLDSGTRSSVSVSVLLGVCSSNFKELAKVLRKYGFLSRTIGLQSQGAKRTTTGC